MSNLRRQIDIKQFNIFNNAPGTLNIDAILKEAVSSALKNCEFSRHEVAAKMSMLLGKEITKTMIDTWSAESKGGHRLPAAYLNAFIEATGNKNILKILCEKAGGHFIDGDDHLRLELARIEEQKGDLLKKEKAIKRFLRDLKFE